MHVGHSHIATFTCTAAAIAQIPTCLQRTSSCSGQCPWGLSRNKRLDQGALKCLPFSMSEFQQKECGLRRQDCVDTMGQNPEQQLDRHLPSEGLCNITQHLVHRQIPATFAVTLGCLRLRTCASDVMFHAASRV